MRVWRGHVPAESASEPFAALDYFLFPFHFRLTRESKIVPLTPHPTVILQPHTTHPSLTPPPPTDLRSTERKGRSTRKRSCRLPPFGKCGGRLACLGNPSFLPAFREFPPDSSSLSHHHLLLHQHHHYHPRVSFDHDGSRLHIDPRVALHCVCRVCRVESAGLGSHTRLARRRVFFYFPILQPRRSPTHTHTRQTARLARHFWTVTLTCRGHWRRGSSYAE